MIMGIFVGYLVLSLIATLIVASACMMSARSDRQMANDMKDGRLGSAKVSVINMREIPSPYVTRGEHSALSPAASRA